MDFGARARGTAVSNRNAPWGLPNSRKPGILQAVPTDHLAAGGECRIPGERSTRMPPHQHTCTEAGILDLGKGGKERQDFPPSPASKSLSNEQGGVSALTPLCICPVPPCRLLPKFRHCRVVSTVQTPSLLIQFCLAELAIPPGCLPAARSICLSLMSPGDAVKQEFHPGAPVDCAYSWAIHSGAAPNSTQRGQEDNFPSCSTNLKPQKPRKP